MWLERGIGEGDVGGPGQGEEGEKEGVTTKGRMRTRRSEWRGIGARG